MGGCVGRWDFLLATSGPSIPVLFLVPQPQRRTSPLPKKNLAFSSRSSFFFSLCHFPSLQLRVLREGTERLTDAEVGADLLAAAVHGAVLGGAHEVLRAGAHARARDGTAPEDLHRLVGDVLHHTGRLVLQQRRGAAQLLAVLEGHRVHLVGDGLKPRPHGLQLRHHARKLEADHRLLDQRLAEDGALAGPLEAVLDDGARLRQHVHDDDPTLVVEVVHHQLETIALPPHQVLHRHLHVVELNVGRAGAGGVRRGDELGGHTLTALDEQHADALSALATRAHRRDKQVGERGVRDPLLRTVHDVVLAARRLLRRAAQRRNVGSDERLRDGERADRLAPEAGLHVLLLHGRGAEVEDGRQPDQVTRAHAVDEAGHAEARELRLRNQLVELVELLARQVARQRDAVLLQVLHPRAGPDARRHQAGSAAVLHHLPRGLFARLVVLLRGGTHGLDPRAARGAELAVRLRVVRRVVVGAEALHLSVLHAGDRVGRHRVHRRRTLGVRGAADAQALVAAQHAQLVLLEEHVGGVLAGVLLEHGDAAGVHLAELAEVVHVAVDHNPHVARRGVRRHLLPGEGLHVCLVYCQ
eukprot:Rhum_TRINITY_DN21064_c0_g1::Rhum_TRINITY_DN21064_c0_g1_i1::g.173056::m.173056